MGASGWLGWRPSLSLRINGWIVAVFSVTLGLSTAASIVQEHRQLVQIETAHAGALLEHLAQMPEFQASFETAASRLEMMHGSLASVGAILELVPQKPVADDRDRHVLLASRELKLRDGDYDLRYLSDRGRQGAAVRRSVLIHMVHGFVALLGLLVGTEWILRRKLVAPVRALSHQVNRMREGGGWLPRVPVMDAELDGLAQALRRLGPGLERQALEWIEAERRSAVALALADLRKRIAEPRRRAFALISDLQARESLSSAGRRKVRWLLAQLNGLSLALTETERGAGLAAGSPGPGSAAYGGGPPARALAGHTEPPAITRHSSAEDGGARVGLGGEGPGRPPSIPFDTSKHEKEES